MIVVCSLLRLKADKRGNIIVQWGGTLPLCAVSEFRWQWNEGIIGEETHKLGESGTRFISFIHIISFFSASSQLGTFPYWSLFSFQTPLPQLSRAWPWSGLPALAANIKMKPNPTTIWCWCWWTPKWLNMFLLQRVRECQCRARMEADLIENAVSVWLQLQLSFNISKRAKSMSACSTIYRQKSIEQTTHNQMIYNL